MYYIMHNINNFFSMFLLTGKKTKLDISEGQSYISN